MTTTIAASKSTVSAKRHHLTKPPLPVSAESAVLIKTSTASSNETDKSNTGADCLPSMSEKSGEKCMSRVSEASTELACSSAMVGANSSCDLPPSSQLTDNCDGQLALGHEQRHCGRNGDEPETVPEREPGRRDGSDEQEEDERAQDGQYNDCKLPTSHDDDHQLQTDQQQDIILTDQHQCQVQVSSRDSAQEVYRNHQVQLHHRPSQYQTLHAYPPPQGGIGLHHHPHHHPQHQQQQFMPTIITDGQLHTIHHHPGQYLPPTPPIIPNYQVLWTQAAYTDHLQYTAVPPHPHLLPPPPPPPPPPHPGHHFFSQPIPDGFALPSAVTVGQLLPAPNYYHHHAAMSPALTYPVPPSQRQAIYTAHQPHIYPAPPHTSATHYYQLTAAPLYNCHSCSTSDQQHQQLNRYNHQTLGQALAEEAAANGRQTDVTSPATRNSVADEEEEQQQQQQLKRSSRQASLMQGHESDGTIESTIDTSPIDKMFPNDEININDSQAATIVVMPQASSCGHSDGDYNGQDDDSNDDDEDEDVDGHDEEIVEVEEIGKEVETNEEEENEGASVIVALAASSEQCASASGVAAGGQHNDDINTINTIVQPDKISYQCEQNIGHECGLRSCIGGVDDNSDSGNGSGGIDYHNIGGKSQNANRHKRLVAKAAEAAPATPPIAAAAASVAAISVSSSSYQTGSSSTTQLETSLECELSKSRHNSHHTSNQAPSLAATSAHSEPDSFILMSESDRTLTEVKKDGNKKEEEEAEKSVTIDRQDESNISQTVSIEVMPTGASRDHVVKEGCNIDCKHPAADSRDCLKQMTDDISGYPTISVANEMLSGRKRCGLGKRDADGSKLAATALTGSKNYQQKVSRRNSSSPAEANASHPGATFSHRQQQQPNQISINGTTFYSVPAAIIQANHHNHHHHQQHYNPHLILSYPYQSLTTNGAHYHHNQQFAVTTTTYPPYFYHQNQPAVPNGSHPPAHHHVTAPGVLLQASASMSNHPIVAFNVAGPQQKIDSQHQHHHHHLSPFKAHTTEPAAGLNPSNVGFSQLKLGYNLIPLLPIDASPTRIRQAYGMDKVWQDEFELLFSKFVSSVVWTLVEVETNPSIRNTYRILNYKGRYIVRAGGNGTGQCNANGGSSTCSIVSSSSSRISNISGSSSSRISNISGSSNSDNFEKCYQDNSSTDECRRTDSSNSSISSGVDASCSLNDGATNGDDSLANVAVNSDTGNCSDSWTEDKQTQHDDDDGDGDDNFHRADDCDDSGELLICDGNADASDQNGQIENKPPSSHCESDCDSGAMLNSTSSGASESMSNEFSTSDAGTQNLTPITSPCPENLQSNEDNLLGNVDVEQEQQQQAQDLQQQQQDNIVTLSEPIINSNGKKFPLRFKMFIDSAKVRFCCDNCGHGWTSMKGRVVFWYELFELIDEGDGISNLIGYCAYKLFGQQCDVCKIENRFERPMWYPEEVTKVLANLYNKIGQVYFGFKMPSIDKQRRAGKPKTSHNSLLCQACHDGVCTDRK